MREAPYSRSMDTPWNSFRAPDFMRYHRCYAARRHPIDIQLPSYSRCDTVKRP